MFDGRWESDVEPSCILLVVAQFGPLGTDSSAMKTSRENTANLRHQDLNVLVARPTHCPALSVGAQATGSHAIGALVSASVAVGAMAIGAIAVGRLVIGRARIRRLEIDELVVRRLRITEKLQTPSDLASERA